MSGKVALFDSGEHQCVVNRTLHQGCGYTHPTCSY